MLTEEQQQQLIDLCKTSQKVLEFTTKKLADGEERLLANAEILRQSNEDSRVLLAFIRSRGLQPPKIHTA
jgi:hypothetical protein